MTQKNERLSLGALSVTSFTTDLNKTGSADLRGGQNLDQTLGTFVNCTGSGFMEGVTICC